MVKKKTRRQLRKIKENRARRIRNRVIIRMTFILSILTITGVVAFNVISTAFARECASVSEVVVASGDTLWSIACEHNSNDEDIRRFVDRIVKYNNLESAGIRAGDILYIPQ